MVSLQSNCTFSFKHHLTIADHFPVPFHSNTTWQLLTISLAKPFLSNTTWQARHGQFAEQFYLFIQTPLDRWGMASLQSNSTISFKHHLQGEAWPACRAILPFHSNTTWQARHGQLAEQFYLFIQTPLDRQAWPACRAILPLHSNTTWQARHGQLAEQFYLFIQTLLDRRGMASLESNSTSSFKHHLTGEACLAWYLYIVRTSIIAKNRHLNNVLQNCI